MVITRPATNRGRRCCVLRRTSSTRSTQERVRACLLYPPFPLSTTARSDPMQCALFSCNKYLRQVQTVQYAQWQHTSLFGLSLCSHFPSGDLLLLQLVFAMGHGRPFLAGVGSFLQLTASLAICFSKGLWSMDRGECLHTAITARLCLDEGKLGRKSHISHCSTL